VITEEEGARVKAQIGEREDVHRKKKNCPTLEVWRADEV